MLNGDDERLFRVEDRLIEIKESISEIKTTLAAQHESLKEHMSRTKQLENRVEPLEKHSLMTTGAFKLISAGIAVITAIYYIVTVLHTLHKL